MLEHIILICNDTTAYTSRENASNTPISLINYSKCSYEVISDTTELMDIHTCVMLAN